MVAKKKSNIRGSSAYPKLRNKGANSGVKKKNSKEVCETFEVKDKKGREKIIRTCGVVESKPVTEKEIDYQNKLLRNIIIIFGGLIIIFIIGYFVVNSSNHFEYRNLKFDVVREKNLIFYKTSLPARYKGNIVPYNFYIRKDPRKLGKNIPFEGKLILLKNVVINTSNEFDCEGDGVIALANLVKLYEFLGAKVIRDKNASCDAEGRYTFIQIQKGDTTKIEQVNTSCYNLNVNNCEILEATERFMIEAFVKANKQ